MDFSGSDKSKERNWWDYSEEAEKTHFLVGKKQLWLEQHKEIQGAEAIQNDWNKKANPLTLLAPTSLPEPSAEQNKHKAT